MAKVPAGAVRNRHGWQRVFVCGSKFSPLDFIILPRRKLVERNESPCGIKDIGHSIRMEQPLLTSRPWELTFYGLSLAKVVMPHAISATGRPRRDGA